jgi:hypothetical protein
MNKVPPSQRTDETSGSSSDPWSRAIRMLAANPDSPESLRIMSTVNACLRPSRQAVDQLVQAFAHQMVNPGEVADAAVQAATAHWESVCRSPLSAEVRQDLLEDATRLVARCRRTPPPIESVVAGVGDSHDFGYDLGLHLEGLVGTWHRLWAALALGRVMGESTDLRECVSIVRTQFEALLGRALTAGEWRVLEDHAHEHGSSLKGA